jgi:hypothetical protein
MAEVTEAEKAYVAGWKDHVSRGPGDTLLAMKRRYLTSVEPETFEDAYARLIRARALQLQAVGPDEFPYGYYENLARHQIAEEIMKGKT